MCTVISLIQALLFIISSFSVQDSNFKFWVDRAAYDIAATSEISFEALDAEEYAVTAEEKQNCRNWYNQNILTAENPAYTFSLDGKKLIRDIKNWDVSIGEESEINEVYSGGKRFDIEMSRRSIPLWRTDYNCMDENGNSNPDILQATQAQTYGISFWLPYSGTCAYIEGEYADRTNILPCSQRLGYQDIRPHMNGNYYPLTYGGLDTSKYLAMQFDTDAKSGMALIYKRENGNDASYLLKLNGLRTDAVYEVYNYDTPDVKLKYTGKQLMTEGIELTINETPKAVIMIYDIAE